MANPDRVKFKEDEPSPDEEARMEALKLAYKNRQLAKKGQLIDPATLNPLNQDELDQIPIVAPWKCPKCGGPSGSDKRNRCYKCTQFHTIITKSREPIFAAPPVKTTPVAPPKLATEPTHEPTGADQVAPGTLDDIAEVIELIEACDLGFHLGSAIISICRADARKNRGDRRKGYRIAELKRAVQHVTRHIEREEMD